MIYLAQSDTTAGLLSQDKARLNALKGRAKDKPCVVTVSSLCVLKGFARVPKAHKALVRRAKKTSFIYPNGLCLRCVKDARHAKFLASFEGGWAYSTSANEHGKDFDINWAKSVADEIFDADILSQGKGSAIFKLGKKSIKKIR